MPEPRRVAIVLVSLEELTEALGLMKHGEITQMSTDRFREGGRIFLSGQWERGGQPPDAAMVREPGEIARAVSAPPGLMVIEAFCTDMGRKAWLKLEGAALPPVMPGQAVPCFTIEVEKVPQPAGLADAERGRLVPL